MQRLTPRSTRAQVVTCSVRQIDLSCSQRGIILPSQELFSPSLAIDAIPPHTPNCTIYSSTPRQSPLTLAREVATFLSGHSCHAHLHLGSLASASRIRVPSVPYAAASRSHARSLWRPLAVPCVSWPCPPIPALSFNGGKACLHSCSAPSICSGGASSTRPLPG
jgi:hypothetical protein